MAGLSPINEVRIYPQQNFLQNNLTAGKVSNKISVDELQHVGIQGIGTANNPPQVGFERVLTDFIQQVNEKQGMANATVNGLLSGKDVSLHQAVIAVEEANVAFSLMVEVRNKVIEAYQELMRMQI